jgi:hypothetical protein
MDTPAFIHSIHSKAIDRACENDRKWFEDNPERICRLRSAMPYEFNGPVDDPPEGSSWRALVTQIEPGMRVRAQVALPTEIRNEADDRQIASIAMPLLPEHLQRLLNARLRKGKKKRALLTCNRAHKVDRRPR